MSGDDEKNSIELVTKEQESTVAEVVENKVEQLVESVGVDVNDVKPLTEEVVATATTVVTEVAKEVAEQLGLKMITESDLSEDQKKLATSIYDSMKDAIKGFVEDPDMNSTVKITKVIGQVIKKLENTKIDGKVITGADKKAVAIHLGRILIKEVTPDDKGEAEILMVYDLIAEQTLEAMIEVSRVVNVAVQELATKCCPGLFEIFKRVKKTA